MGVSKPFYGIKELYRPLNGPADIDIVAVHGLNGHATRTWTSEDNGVCWLSHQEYLPRHVPQARVLAFGYNASTSSLIADRPSSDRILEHAQTFVSQLAANRAEDGAQERPIMFVCHSLGGIIVKRALTYSAAHPKLAGVHSIFTCTYGILFFGTPHNGSSKSRLARRLQKIASFVIPKRFADFELDLIKALEAESETLQNITDHFVPLMDNFHIYFFWEQEKTDLKYTRAYIVDRWSAAPHFDNTERCGIAADHRGICRFSSTASQAFQIVIATLKEYAQEAPDVIHTRCVRAASARKEATRQKAYDLLKMVPPPESETDQLVSGTPGFGKDTNGDTAQVAHDRFIAEMPSQESETGDLYFKAEELARRDDLQNTPSPAAELEASQPASEAPKAVQGSPKPPTDEWHGTSIAVTASYPSGIYPRYVAFVLENLPAIAPSAIFSRYLFGETRA